MARLIVALDIGVKQVRMAALSHAGREFEIVRTGEQPVLPEEGAKPAVDRLLAELGQPIESVVGVAALQSVSLRTLKLQVQFSDRKKIDQVLPFELEGVFPFDPEDAVFNYTIIAKTPEGGAELLVGAARKEFVAGRIEAYRQAGHEPRNLLLDAFALEAAWRAAEPVAEEAEAAATTGFLHIGPDESLLLLARGDGYRSARAIRIGYRESVARAARKLAREPEEVAAALRDGSLAPEGVFAAIVQEVETTLRSAEKTARVRASRLIVSGSAAAWPGVVDALGQALNIPASALRWGDQELGDYAPLAGAVVQSAQGGGGIDLRSGEFTYTRAIQLVKGKLFLTGAFAAVLLLLIIGGNVATWLVKSRQASVLQDDIEAAFQEAMPNEPVVDPLQQVQAHVRTLRRQVEGTGGQGVVDILKGMSQGVDAGLSFKMGEFHKDASGVRIKGETDSYEHIDQIKNAVSALPGLKDIKVTDSKTTANGTVVFELSLEGAGG